MNIHSEIKSKLNLKQINCLYCNSNIENNHCSKRPPCGLGNVIISTARILCACTHTNYYHLYNNESNSRQCIYLPENTYIKYELGITHLNPDMIILSGFVPYIKMQKFLNFK